MQDDQALDAPVDAVRHQSALAQLGLAHMEIARQQRYIEVLRAEVMKAGPIALDLMKARAEIDAAWHMIENGWDIESRAELEKQAATNGFQYGLAQAVHHMWKRELKARKG